MTRIRVMTRVRVRTRIRVMTRIRGVMTRVRVRRVEDLADNTHSTVFPYLT